ncbi:MAG: class I SAM-dependent methyltransferase, partial [Cytophagales bacterium]|nr:class I SAM-dependent methyltransferase [Cytophagales bacterium]
MHSEESPFQKPNHSDPLGAALLDYLAGKTNGHIIVHSNISDDEVMSVAHFFRNTKGLPELEQTALRHCHGRVLDVGAGAGSHALALQSQGVDVTAVDASTGAAEVMRRRGVRSVCHSDIMRFTGASFDTLLMLMNGIGLVGTLDGLAAFLEYAKTLLNP